MSRRGGKRKRERPHHDRSYHPDQGAQEQHIADAPRSHGEPRHALPLVFQEPFWGSGWSFGRKQTDLTRRSNCQCGWAATILFPVRIPVFELSSPQWAVADVTRFSHKHSTMN